MNNWQTRFSITDASVESGLSVETIRGYCEEFAMVLGPVEIDKKGKRIFTLDQVRKLTTIRKWRNAPRIDQYLKSEFSKEV